ncbi:hypothetical protein ACQUW5_08100 [Legionella sp. CNM-1927-20]|uniref:hypothetical protein n=1 Tax=Legionella sp. CNM-1927-20 TaxID=3422221 RepID=UPI00403A84F1
MATKFKLPNKLTRLGVSSLTCNTEIPSDIELERRGPTVITGADLDHFLVNTLQDRNAEEILKQLPQKGFQYANDVIGFLNTTETGKAVRVKIVEEFIKMIEEEEHIRKEVMEDEARHHQMLAYLLLKLADKEDEKNYKQICEYAQEQIEKILQRDKDRQKFLNAQNSSELDETLTYTNNLIKETEDELKDKTDELTIVDKELSKIDEYGKSINSRYRAFETGLSNLEKENYKFDPANPASKDAARGKIARRIEGLQAEVEKQRLEIETCLINGDDKKAMDKKPAYIALYVQVGELQDMLDVYDGEATLYDKEGNKVDSFDDATYYILRPDQKFIKENNTLLLVDKKTDFNNENWKEKAANRTRDSLIMSKLISETEKAENKFHQERKSNTSERKSTLTQEITQLKTQLQQLQAAKASIEAELRNKSNPNLGRAAALGNLRPSSNGSDPHKQLQSILGPAVADDFQAASNQEYLRQQSNAAIRSPRT